MRRIFPLALATFISDFGSALTLSALPVMFVLAGKKEGIGIYNGFDSFGSLIGSIWIIAFIDRFRKNRIAVFADIIRAIALLPLILTDNVSVGMIAFYSLAQSIFGAATTSAIQAWITEHPMKEDELKKANSSLEIASQIARASAPIVGMALLTKFDPKTVFAIDAASYVIGAFLVARLKSAVPAARANSFVTEFKEGLAYCLQNPKLIRWISVSGIQFLGLAIMNTVYLAILSDQIKANDQQIAFFQMAYFLGALIGSSYGYLSKRSPVALLKGSSVALALVMGAAIFTTNYAVFFAFAVLQRAATIASAICTRTLCQRDSDPVVSGRVMAFRSASIDVFGMVFYAGAVAAFGKVPMYSLLAIGALSFFVSLLFTRDQAVLQTNSVVAGNN